MTVLSDCHVQLFWIPRKQTKQQKRKGGRKSLPNRSPKKNGSRRKKVSNQNGLPPVDECSAKYMLACVDPWSPEAIGACVPTIPSRPSFKHTSWKKATITIGTAGYGFAIFSPSLCNDLVCMWTTTSSYTTDTAAVSIDSPQVGTTAHVMSNLPYDSTYFVDTTAGNYIQPMKGRIVSVSASVYYTGTELDRGGRTVCYVSPDHTSVNNFTFSDTISRREASEEMSRPDRSKCMVVAHGLDPTELEYPDVGMLESADDKILKGCFPFSNDAGLSTTGIVDKYVGAPIMIIFIQGKAGNTYALDVVQHSEFIGKAADAMLSPNVVSAEGFALAQTALNDLPMMKVARPKASMRQLLRTSLVKSAKALTSKRTFAVGKQMLAAALL